MGDFIAYAEDEEAGLDVLVHFGILGQKHGQRNGPPYPLGSGDHSAKEKQAASAAGVKVGSDSGKGSIDNVKKKKSTRSKSPKKPLTPEEKREQAMAAARSGDKKKIAKNIDELSTDELRDAAERARLKEQLTKKDEHPGEKKMSKEDLAKQEAMRSGDKEQIKLYADKMSNDELVQALNRVELNQKLNHVDPGPSALDRVQKIANAVDKMRDAAEKGIKAYNVAAQVYNSTHKGEGEWPIIGPQNKDNNGGDKKDKEKDDTKKAVEQIAKEVKKSYEEQRKEKYENQKTDYEYDKKFEKWKKKQEEKEAAKEEKKQKKQKEQDEAPASSKSSDLAKTFNDSADEYQNKYGTRPNIRANENETQSESKKKYTPERAPEFKKTFFNTKKFEDSESKESSDNQTKNSDQNNREVKSTYDDIKDTPISSYDKRYQRDINDSFDDIMSDYNESVRRQQVTAQERQDRAETANNAKKLMRDALREDNNEAAAYWLEVIRNNE